MNGKSAYSINLEIFVKIVSALFFALLLVLSLVYVFQINSEVGARYVLAEIEAEFEKLSKANKTIEIAALKENSLESVSDMILNLNFEKTGNIRYIRVLENQAVLK